VKDFVERLSRIREEAFGKNGRSAFARALGIPLTSYLNFEHGRVPPVYVLVKMVAVTRVNPRWLVHGKGPRLLPEGADVPTTEDAVSLIANLLEGNARLNEELRAAKREAHPAVLVVPAGAEPKEWLAEQGQIQASADDYLAVPVLSGKNAENPPENVFEAGKDGWVLCPRSVIKHPKSTFGFRVQDEAMLPAIPQGSLVGIDCSLRDPERLLEAGRHLVAERDRSAGCVVRQLGKAEKHWLFVAAEPTGIAGTLVWSPSEEAKCPVIGRVIFVVVAC
jgi:SOS-response transcriptional repressor LexA